MELVKVIVFDFDNCIALDERTGEGSEEIKDRAWFEVFHECGKLDLEFVVERAKLSISGGRGDRNDIVARVLEYFGYSGRTISNEIIRRCSQFDEIVQKGIWEMGISLNVIKTLEELSKTFSLYINSATPRDAVLETLHAAGLTCFKVVYGRPGNKVGNLRLITEAESVFPNEILFVGDMPGDYEAALAIGCRFVGIYTKRNTLWHDPQPFPIIRSITELPQIIR